MNKYLNSLQEAQSHIKRNAIFYIMGYLPVMVLVMWKVQSLMYGGYYDFKSAFRFGDGYGGREFDTLQFALMMGIGLVVSIMVVIPLGLKIFKSRTNAS